MSAASTNFNRPEFKATTMLTLTGNRVRMCDGVSRRSFLQIGGLDKDVTVVVWGEFGRTPKINERAGRDHWPGVHAALLAGGGMRTGQVIGSTNRLAEEAADRPVHMQEVFATVYRNLGINVASTTIPDNNGRPQYLVERHDVIGELV